MISANILKLDDFSGGLVTKGNELGLETKQTPDCLNVHSDAFKTLQKRLGYTKLNSSSVSSAFKGIYNYRRGESEQYLVSLIATTGGTVAFRKMDVVTSAWDGTWDTVTVDATRGTAITNGIMYNTTFNGDLIITNDAQTVPQKYDPNDYSGAYTNLSFETQHATVTGVVTTYTGAAGATLKIVLDTSHTYDDIDLSSAATIDNVVTLINAVSGLSTYGIALKNAAGYLVVYSLTTGTGSNVVVASGTADTKTTATTLFGASSTTATGLASGAPSGKFCATWNNYVWIFNISGNPDRFYHSTLGNHLSWPATYWNDVVTPGDIGITGVCFLRGVMNVFKKNSINRVSYLGGTPLLDVRPIKTSIGTTSPRSIVNVETVDNGEVTIFLGSDLQLYMFDGTTAGPISEPISTYNGISNYCTIGENTTYGINSSVLANCHAVNNTKRHWYILYFCLGNATTPTDAIIYDYYSKSLWPFHFNDGKTVSCLSDNGAGQKRIYSAGTNYAWLEDSGNNDDGAAINAYWTSAKLDLSSEIQEKEFRTVTLSTASVATTPLFQYKMDWEASYSTAVTMLTSTRDHNFDIPRFENFYQMKISDNSTSAAFQLIRASIAGMKRGIGR